MVFGIRTKPETAVERPESISVLVPPAVKIDFRVFSPLDDLMHEEQLHGQTGAVPWNNEYRALSY